MFVGYQFGLGVNKFWRAFAKSSVGSFVEYYFKLMQVVSLKRYIDEEMQRELIDDLTRQYFKSPDD